MAVKFLINEETGESTLRELRQTIEDMNVLVANCDETIAALQPLDKTMSLNKPAIGLVESAKEALQAVIPALDEALTPIEAFAKNMVAANAEIAGSTAGSLDLS